MKAVSIRSAFTLIELVGVLLIIAIASAIVVRQIGDQGDGVHIVEMQHDLRNMAIAQQHYFDVHGRYGSLDDIMDMGFAWSSGVSPDSSVVFPEFWYLRVRHDRTDTRCDISMSLLIEITDNRIRCPGGAPAPPAELGPADPGYASPVAVFTFEPDSAPAGTQVQFDGSASDPVAGEIVTWEWDFGDWSSSITDGPAVEHAFADAGAYTVTLTITTSHGRQASTRRVVTAATEAGPTAAFTLWAAPNTVGSPNPATIYTTTWLYPNAEASYADAGGTLVRWQWENPPGTTCNFSYGSGPMQGDCPPAGTGGDLVELGQLYWGAQPGPTTAFADRHWRFRFTEPGMRAVRLTVTDNYGASAAAERLVEVLPAPDWSACFTAPDTVALGAPFAYDYGCTYVEHADHPDTYTVSTSEGLSLTRPSRWPPLAGLWYFDATGLGDMTNTLPGFTTTGTHTVTLTFGEKVASKQIVVIAEPNAVIVSPPSAVVGVGAEQPFTATVNDANGNPIPDASVTWSVDDGDVGSIDQDGVFTAADLGTTLVRATAGAIEGTASIEVANPVAAFTFSPDSAPAGTAVLFDGRASDPVAGEITAWEWDFGDWSTTSTEGPMVDHAFPGPGTYTVTLTITTDYGADAITQRVVTVATEHGPTAAFTLWPVPNTVGSPNPATIYTTTRIFPNAVASHADVGGELVRWQWENPPGTTCTFTYPGSGVQSTCPPDGAAGNLLETDEMFWGAQPNPATAFSNRRWSFRFTEPGVRTVRLTVTDNYGKTAEAQRTINVLPAPNWNACFTAPDTVDLNEAITYNYSCTYVQHADQPDTYTVTTSQGFNQTRDSRWPALAGLWYRSTAGMGNMTNTLPGFTSAGTHTVTLTFGTKSTTKQIVVRPQAASLVVSPPVAIVGIGDTQQFTASVYDAWGNLIPDAPVSWSLTNWPVGSVNQNGLFTAQAVGITNVRATSGSVQGMASVQVPGPVARFTFSPNNAPAKLPVSFDGRSSSAGVGSIISWEWDFGDWTPLDHSGPLVDHSFELKGRYNVRLTIRNSYNQTASVTHPVDVADPPIPPTVDFTLWAAPNVLGDNPTTIYTSTFLAPNAEAAHANGGATLTSWAWDLDGMNSSQLRMTLNGGNINTWSQPPTSIETGSLYWGSQAHPDLPYRDAAGNPCVRAGAPPSNLACREWLLTAPAPGTYTIKLTVTDSNSQSSTKEHKIQVLPAPPWVPCFSAPDTVDVGEEVPYDFTCTYNVHAGYEFDYTFNNGDGEAQSGHMQFPIPGMWTPADHYCSGSRCDFPDMTGTTSYSQPGTYTMSLTVNGNTTTRQIVVSGPSAPVGCVPTGGAVYAICDLFEIWDCWDAAGGPCAWNVAWGTSQPQYNTWITWECSSYGPNGPWDRYLHGGIPSENEYYIQDYTNPSSTMWLRVTVSTTGFQHVVTRVLETVGPCWY